MTNLMVIDSRPGATAAPTLKGLPRWHRVVLAALVAIAGALYAWNLGDSGFMSFYATAAKSMSESWRAFFFGTFDPGASITLDKLAGFVVPQALSARLFGFSQVSVTLPQVIEGMITVMVGYRVVRQWANALTGLAAAAALAFTPLLVSMFGHSMEDGMLSMFCVLAVMSWQDAIRTGKLRWLLLAGVWVGLGFQAKMMEAWLIVPALGIAYLLTAPHQLARRIRHVLVFGVVTLAVSLSWMTAIQLVPADSRPYVDGSTNNNMYSMVFGYNGFNRFIPDLVPGAVKDTMAQPRGGVPGGAGDADRFGTARSDGLGAVNGGQPGQGDFGRGPLAAAPAGGFGGGASASPLKLVSTTYTSQIGWLYPLALAGAVLGFAGVRRRALGRNLRSGVWVSTLWLAVSAVVMGAMRIPHTAYLAILAFPLAALSAIALTLAVKEYRSADARWRRLILPALLGVQTVWAVFVAATTGLLEPWLPLVIAVTGLLAVGALASKFPGRIPSLPVPAVAGLAGVSLLLGPLLWSGSVLVPGYAGSAMDAYAGPRADGGFGGFTHAGGAGGRPAMAGQGAATSRNGSADHNASASGPGNAHAAKGNDVPHGFGAPNGASPATGNAGRTKAAGFAEGPATLDASDLALLHLTETTVKAGAPVFATDSWNTASKFIMAAGADVLPFGGFSGTAPSLTLDRFTSMVTSGQLKYVLLSESLDTSAAPTPQGFMRAASYPDVKAIHDWMNQHFQLVPPTQYAGNQASTAYLYQYKG